MHDMRSDDERRVNDLACKLAVTPLSATHVDETLLVIVTVYGMSG